MVSHLLVEDMRVLAQRKRTMFFTAQQVSYEFHILVSFPCPLSPMGIMLKHTDMDAGNFISTQEKINKLCRFIQQKPTQQQKSTYFRYTQ